MQKIIQKRTYVSATGNGEGWLDPRCATRTYTHDGAGGPVRAASAADAARILAKRAYGRHSGVESLLFVARTFAGNGFGGNGLGGKEWTATIVSLPTAEQRIMGGFVQQRATIGIKTGSIAVNDKPASRWTGLSRPADLIKTGPWRHRPGVPVPVDTALEQEHRRMAAEAASAWDEEKRLRKGFVGSI